MTRIFVSFDTCCDKTMHILWTIYIHKMCIVLCVHIGNLLGRFYLHTRFQQVVHKILLIMCITSYETAYTHQFPLLNVSLSTGFGAVCG